MSENPLGIIAAILILAAAGGWYYFDKEQKTSLRVAAARVHYNASESRLTERRQILQSLEMNQDVYQRAHAAYAQVTLAKERLDQITRQIFTEQQRLEQIVEARRRSSVGQSVSQLVLRDGRTYKDARILKVEDETVSLLTSDGVLRLPAANLPDHLQQYYRFDLAPPPPPPRVVGPTDVNSPEYQAALRQAQMMNQREMDKFQREEYQRKTTELREVIAAYDKQISALQKSKNDPLPGMDSRIPVGTKAWEFRKRDRDKRLEQQIATAQQKRKETQAQLDEMSRKRFKK